MKTAENILFEYKKEYRVGNVQDLTTSQILSAMEEYKNQSSPKLAEMPTDEEIEKEADLWDEHNGDELGMGHVGFIDGMKIARSLFSRQEVKKGFEEWLDKTIQKNKDMQFGEFDGSVLRTLILRVEILEAVKESYTSFLPKEDREQKPDGWIMPNGNFLRNKGEPNGVMPKGFTPVYFSSISKDREEGWIDVKEDLPSRNTPVIVFDGERVIDDCTMNTTAEFWVHYHGYDNDSYEVKGVTHWRTLPSPPDSGKDKKGESQ